MIGKDSRYAACILYTGGDADLLGARPRIDTTPRPDDQFHTVAQGDQIDRIAYRYLGDARLWWIVCDYNDIFYPLELEVGAVLRIPAVEYVQMRLFA